MSDEQIQKLLKKRSKMSPDMQKTFDAGIERTSVAEKYLQALKEQLANETALTMSALAPTEPEIPALPGAKALSLPTPQQLLDSIPEEKKSEYFIDYAAYLAIGRQVKNFGDEKAQKMGKTYERYKNTKILLEASPPKPLAERLKASLIAQKLNISPEANDINAILDSARTHHNVHIVAQAIKKDGALFNELLTTDISEANRSALGITKVAHYRA